MRQAMLVCAGLVVQTTPATAECRWLADRDTSAITFTATMQGAPFDGRFGAFDADILFDPADPATGRVKVTVPLAGVDTQFSERDDELRKIDWFDVARFPAAVYEATTFARTDGNGYTAAGTLTLRGTTVPVPLAFTLKVTGDTAEAIGTARLNRLDFGLGWPSTEMVGADVDVHIAVVARRAPGATCRP